MSAAFLCVLAGTAAAEPEREQIETYLAGALPATLAVADFDLKAFPAGDHAGRVSIAGTLLTTEPLFYEDCNCPYPSPELIARNYAPFIQAAAARGVPPGQVMAIATARKVVPTGLGKPLPLFKLRHPTGTAIPFRAELRYLETVNGYDLTGKPDYDLAKLQTEAQIGQFGLIMDSEAYLRAIDIVVAIHGEQARKQALHRGEIERFLTGGYLVGRFPLIRGQPPQDVFVLDFGAAPFTWIPERQVGGEVQRWRFERSGTLRWLTPAALNGQPYQAGDEVTIALGGKYVTTGEPMQNAELWVDIPADGQRRKQKVTGGLRWTGEMFVNHAGMPDNGWQVTFSPEVPQASAPPATAPSSAPEAPEDPGTAAADPLAALQGLWQTSDGKMKIHVEGNTGRITTGGSGARPNGIDMLIVDEIATDGTIQGRTRFGGGQHVGITARLAGDVLSFSGRGYQWQWRRAD